MPSGVTKGMAKPYKMHISLAFLEGVLHRAKAADVCTLAFRDPDAFMVGNIHDCVPVWQHIVAVALARFLQLLVLVWVLSLFGVSVLRLGCFVYSPFVTGNRFASFSVAVSCSSP